MSEHPSKLTFSIEESVWLNKGQEVEAILGMSLEPEIVIEERDQQVYIKGGLRLVGQYESAEHEEEEVKDTLVSERIPVHSVGNVSKNEDNVHEVMYFLPVDITIPLNRIKNLDDVYVQIESFDYDLPERSCIQLTADISISGMMNPQANTIEEKKKDEGERLNIDDTAFSFDAKKQDEEKEREWIEIEEEVNELSTQVEIEEEEPISPSITPNTIEEVEQPSIVASDDNKIEMIAKAEAMRDEESNVEHDEEENEERHEESVELVEPVKDEPQGEVSDETVVQETVEISEKAEAEEVGKVEEAEEEATLAVLLEEREEPEATEATKITLTAMNENVTEEIEEEEVEEKAVIQREENALYLTKMMANEEEQFITWKMCIIQENESLEMIADRYEVSTSHLMRVNRLEQERVEEGQILYIPVLTK